MLANNYEPALLEIYHKEGCIDRQKSYLAIDQNTKKILALGNEAEYLINDNNACVINPFKQGVICDFIVAEKILGFYIKKYSKALFFQKMKIVLVYPRECSEIQIKAMEDALAMNGVKDVHILSDAVEIPVGGYEEVLKKFKCHLLIRITQDNPQIYVKEKADELVEYAQQNGISKECLIDMMQ